METWKAYEQHWEAVVRRDGIGEMVSFLPRDRNDVLRPIVRRVMTASVTKSFRPIRSIRRFVAHVKYSCQDPCLGAAAYRRISTRIQVVRQCRHGDRFSLHLQPEQFQGLFEEKFDVCNASDILYSFCLSLFSYHSLFL